MSLQGSQTSQYPPRYNIDNNPPAFTSATIFLYFDFFRYSDSNILWYLDQTIAKLSSVVCFTYKNCFRHRHLRPSTTTDNQQQSFELWHIFEFTTYFRTILQQQQHSRVLFQLRLIFDYDLFPFKNNILKISISDLSYFRIHFLIHHLHSKSKVNDDK